MKKIILILAAPILLFSCNNSEDNKHDAAVVETTNDAMMIDYSTLTFSEQEADMNDRLTFYRSAETNVAKADRVRYIAVVDKLENDIVIYRVKRIEYEKNPENEELKVEVQTLGDRIRATADDINDEFKSVGETLKAHHNQKVDDVTEAAEDVADGAKRTGETLKDHHDQKVKDVKKAAQDVKDALKTD